MQYLIHDPRHPPKHVNSLRLEDIIVYHSGTGESLKKWHSDQREAIKAANILVGMKSS